MIRFVETPGVRALLFAILAVVAGCQIQSVAEGPTDPGPSSRSSPSPTTGSKRDRFWCLRPAPNDVIACHRPADACAQISADMRRTHSWESSCVGVSRAYCFAMTTGYDSCWETMEDCDVMINYLEKTTHVGEVRTRCRVLE